MVKNKKGYYYCRECGALVETALKEPGKQTCEVCGGTPQDTILKSGLKKGRVETSFQFEEPEKEPVPVSERTALNDISHRNTKKKALLKKRKKGRKKGVFILVMLSLVTIAIVAGLSEWRDFFEKKFNAISGNLKGVEESKAKRDQYFLNNAVPLCQHVMSNFLKTNSVAGKAQFVVDGPSLVGDMARYYKSSLEVLSDVHDCKVMRAEMLSGFEHSAIIVLFANSKGDKWECVFVLDEGVWKVDWKFLVKYDSLAWTSFLEGKEGTVGDFRLYMRLLGGNDEFRKSEISVKFYKPGKNLKDDYDETLAPTGTMPPNSLIGKEISALFANQSLKDKKRKDKHGLSTGAVDPEGFCRVRVRLKMHREGKDKKRSRIEVLKILSTNWYGIKEKEQ